MAKEEAKKKFEKDAWKRAEFQVWWQVNLERKGECQGEGSDGGDEGTDSAKGSTGREAQTQGAWHGTI